MLVVAAHILENQFSSYCTPSGNGRTQVSFRYADDSASSNKATVLVSCLEG
ncbi:MAG: hypothetical protein HY313_01150 [Acidobacteria bacterium]|nr:hypothetical protein [Acidobacteriota bacterium]